MPEPKGPAPQVQPPRIADNSANWPSLAIHLAPAAGCDCQMLAMAITESLQTIAPRPAAKPRR